MKKVALVTFHRPLSIGAQLQAFALQEAIQTNDCDCRVIDYEPAFPNKSRILSPSWRIYSTITGLVFARKIKSQSNRFTAWASTHLHQTEPITTLSQLKQVAEDFDTFVCGSDQIWRIPNRGYYFLDFTPDSARRIAYAPSFGNINFDNASKELIKEYLSRFDSISVRENDGAKFVSELLGYDVPSVLDPTLLWSADYWRNYAVDPGGSLPKRFVLLFSIQDTMPCFRAAKKISVRLGIPLVVVDTARRLIWHPFLNNYFDVGPAEFLRLVDLADFVVTSSFHGTAFAINFGKPFLTICRKESENVNSRITTLADKLNTSDRLISPDDEIPEPVFNDLDPEINIRLDEERICCRNILTKFLFLTGPNK